MDDLILIESSGKCQKLAYLQDFLRIIISHAKEYKDDDIFVYLFVNYQDTLWQLATIYVDDCLLI